MSPQNFSKCLLQYAIFIYIFQSLKICPLKPSEKVPPNYFFIVLSSTLSPTLSHGVPQDILQQGPHYFFIHLIFIF
jgi:hypothetical protein